MSVAAETAVAQLASALAAAEAERKRKLEEAAAERAAAELAALAPPDPLTPGAIRVRLSHAAGLDAQRAFVRLAVGAHRQVSRVAERRPTSGWLSGLARPNDAAARWDADFVFGGTFGELAAQPMVVSAWESDGETRRVRLLGEGRVDLPALVSRMHGVDVAVPIGAAQLVLSAAWTADPLPRPAAGASGTLRVRLTSGIDLVGVRSGGGRGEPYVTVRVGGHEWRSGVAEGWPHPTWGEAFELHGAYGELSATPLVVSAYDAAEAGGAEAGAPLGAGS
eukprot:7387912-Prymnesium_polylepis.1